MNILIIGGTRFFGYRTALALNDAGHDVAVFTRGKRQVRLPDGIEHIIGDREVDEDLERAAAARRWDVVWDNMSRTEAHARGAVRIFRDRSELFIYTSTLAVYSICEGIDSPYDEDDFARGRPLEERRGTYPYDYGLGRRAGERVLQEAFAEFGFPYVSVRLPAVLGPMDYSLRAWSYWRRIVEDGRLILPDGGSEMHRSMHSGDVVRGMLAIMERGGEVAGRAYNLAGGEIISLRNFVERSAKILGTEVEIVDLPRSTLVAAGIDPNELSPYTTWGDHLHSIARAQHELGFAPTPIDEWLGATIEWHRENRREAEPPGWGLRAREAELATRYRAFLDQLPRASDP